jgi:bifunctional non-homologous end joining protein LigD
VITHPDKLIFPEDGITKGDLAAYYEAIAPVMLPYLRGRPVTMERYPAGIGEKGFWQKDVSKGFPEWLKRVEVPKKKGVVHYPLIPDVRSLLWVTNQNTVTQHVWTSRVPNLQCPRSLRLRSRSVRRTTPRPFAGPRSTCVICSRSWDCPSWIKTSGSKGYHIVVPVAVNTPVGLVADFANQVGTALVHRASEQLTQEFARAKRHGRIYVDTGRNGYGATFAAAYAVRAKRGAPVSAPCSWEEIERGDVHPQTFTLRDHARSRRAGWRPVGRHATRPFAGTADGASARARGGVSYNPPAEVATNGRSGMALRIRICARTTDAGTNPSMNSACCTSPGWITSSFVPLRSTTVRPALSRYVVSYSSWR